MKYRFIKYISVPGLICLLVLAGTACSNAPAKQSNRTTILNVKPGMDIQSVVDKAKPGDLILVDAGTYSGNIRIKTPDIALRGKDRNSVIIDGKYAQDNGIDISANGVRIENITVQAFKSNGISIQAKELKNPGLTIERYLIQYVNALNNGQNGISVDNANSGIIANTFTKANARAGISISQCQTCNSAVMSNIGVLNGTGLFALNTSQNIYALGNNFSENRTGKYIASDMAQKLSDNRSVFAFKNTAIKNDSADAPGITKQVFGFGIYVSGASNTLIESNSTDENGQVGLMLGNNNDILPEGNSFKNNISHGNGVPFGFDMAYIITGTNKVFAQSNCFENNQYSSSSIDLIQQLLPCKNAEPGPFVSQQFKYFAIPDPKAFSDIPIESQNQKSKPESVEKIPSKLKKLKQSDLDKFVEQYR